MYPIFIFFSTLTFCRWCFTPFYFCNVPDFAFGCIDYILCCWCVTCQIELYNDEYQNAKPKNYAVVAGHNEFCQSYLQVAVRSDCTNCILRVLTVFEVLNIVCYLDFSGYFVFVCVNNWECDMLREQKKEVIFCYCCHSDKR